MLFKTDENIHPEVAEFLRSRGHDAVTVWDQNLQGHDDVRVSTVCRDEQRILLTTDAGFGDIRAYPPDHYAGIIVLRLSRQSRRAVLAAAATIDRFLSREPVHRRLWIVEENNIRIRGGNT